MLTVNNTCEHEIIIKKSRFICYLYKVNNLDDINNYLNSIKEEHKNARHVCYAYILDNQKKASDDKEPSGTAGIPMLTMLEQKDLNHVLAIVVRYFGGIKLGTGGLFRAYTTVLKETIEENELVNLETKYQYQISLDINNANILNNIQGEIISKNYTDILTVTIITNEDIDDYLKNNKINIIKKDIII